LLGWGFCSSQTDVTCALAPEQLGEVSVKCEGGVVVSSEAAPKGAGLGRVFDKLAAGS
jgi:hypothetical protein